MGAINKRADLPLVTEFFWGGEYTVMPGIQKFSAGNGAYTPGGGGGYTLKFL